MKIVVLTTALLMSGNAFAQESAATYDSGVRYYTDEDTQDEPIIVWGWRHQSDAQSQATTDFDRAIENDFGENRTVYRRRLMGLGRGSLSSQLSASGEAVGRYHGAPNDDGNHGALRAALVFPTPLFGPEDE